MRVPWDSDKADPEVRRRVEELFHFCEDRGYELVCCVSRSEEELVSSLHVQRKGRNHVIHALTLLLQGLRAVEGGDWKKGKQPLADPEVV